MKRAAASVAGIATAIAVSLTVGLSAVSCEQTATNVPVHSLELPQKLQAVCIQVNDANGNAIPNPVPLPEAQCTLPAVTNTNPTALPNHLYAVVTQTRRGALGVIDLTAGVVVDVDKSNPGFDAIPVGANPTDVAVTPDGAFTYVSSAATNRPGLYGIDNRYLLGDSTGSIGPAVPLRLPNVPSCGLPQAPEALGIVPAPAADGGPPSGYLLVAALDATSTAPASVITVDPASLKPGSLDLCKVVGVSYLSSTLPPVPGPGPAWPDGVPYADTSSLQDAPPLGGTCPAPVDGGAPAPSVDGGDEAAVADAGGDEGSIADGGAEDATLGDAEAVAESGAEGGVEAAAPPLPPGPARPTAMLLRSDMPVAYVADDKNPLIHVVDLSDPTAPHELAPLLATALPAYGAADQTARRVSVGSIALSPPVRVLSPPTASSPPPPASLPAYLSDYHVDYKTYLYAVDAQQGTLMVYDVTDPVSSPHVPLVRPHSELSPLLPPDRIVFAAPVVAVSFVQHDWPVPSTTRDVQYTGLLCNPNPHAFPNPNAPPLDLGAYYRGDQTSFIQAMDTQGGTIETLPTRLRGVFAFATLSNGTSAVVDVDDWDAPCRRPDPMDGPYALHPDLTTGAHRRGALDVPQPVSSEDTNSPSYFDPYATPVAYDPQHQTSGVTLEPFFPVSAPHRPRSSVLLRNDPTSGQHSPFLLTPPQLFNASGAAVASTGAAGSVTSTMLPTPLPPNWIDPSYLANPLDPSTTGQTPPAPLGMSASGAAGNPSPGGGLPAAFTGLFPGPSVTPSVRLSFDDPTAEVDQDWTVAYEGALPTVPFGSNGVSVDLVPEDDYSSLKLTAQGARFCARGIEDRNIGAERLQDFTRALGDVGLPSPPVFDTGLPAQPSPTEWTGDYVEIADDLLPSTDPYWGRPSDPPGAAADNDCWDDGLQSSTVVQGTTSIDPTIASNRYNFCLNTFGSAATADTELLRDLPIWQANDNWLQVTRFAWYDKDPSGAEVLEQTTNRVMNPPDPSNAPWLRAVRCCFHHQATFKVRTGGEWVASGSVVGLLHRVVADPETNNCVLSCDPHQALLNARSFDVPWGTLVNAGDSACTPVNPKKVFDRDNPLAMRNPMFSFVMWGGCGPRPGYGDHTLTARDLTWKFSLRGSSTPLSVSLITQGGGNAVSPQSMRFLPSFGQLGIVDGASQGLELIDLNLVSVVKEYF